MTTPDLSSLRYDGDKVELDDGRVIRLRLRFEPDYDTNINDFDAYGKVEWTRDNDYGAVRPKTFTGRARLMQRDRWQSQWWEPYEEMTDADIRAEMPRMRELIEYGFKVLCLELCDGHDAYGNLIVQSVEYLGGVEFDDVPKEYIDDMYDELMD